MRAVALSWRIVPVERALSATRLTYRKLVCTPVTPLPVVDMTCARAIRAGPDQGVDRETRVPRAPPSGAGFFPTGRRSRRCRPFGALIELHEVAGSRGTPQTGRRGMEVFVQQLINGITLGSIYGLIALGYTMVFGIIGMVNFAHGDVFMVSVFISLITFLILTAWIGISSIALALLIVLIVAMVFTSIVNWTIERVDYRPLRGSFRLAPLISAIEIGRA